LGKSSKEKVAILVAFLLLMISNPLTSLGFLAYLWTDYTGILLAMVVPGTVINIYLAARLIK